MNRREFIRGAAACGLFAGCATTAERFVAKGEIHAVLLHLGHNMWKEWLPESVDAALGDAPGYDRPHVELALNETLWRRATARAAEKGLNMVVIDIGEGLAYPSHPELGIRGSWSADKLRDEVNRLRGMGLEPIPKLNFSATHDGWLKDYHRMLTLPKWYEVAKDVINDVVDIFGTPRFFHLGWDEEYASYSTGCQYFVMRADEMWWHDFLYTVRCVEDRGVRPWVWSDKGWKDDSYYTRCPKSVVQSDWYYDEFLGGFDVDNYKADHQFHRLKQFYRLEEAGFDQIPCGTNWVSGFRRKKGCAAEDVIGRLVKLGREVIPPARRLGFLMAPWAMCDTEEHTAVAERGIDLFADALAGRIAPAGKAG